MLWPHFDHNKETATTTYRSFFAEFHRVSTETNNNAACAVERPPNWKKTNALFSLIILETYSLLVFSLAREI